MGEAGAVVERPIVRHAGAPTCQRLSSTTPRRRNALAVRSTVPALVSPAAPLLWAGRIGHALLLLALLLLRAGLLLLLLLLLSTRLCLGLLRLLGLHALLLGSLELLLPLLLCLPLLHLGLSLRLLLGLLLRLHPGLHLLLCAGLLLLLLHLLLTLLVLGALLRGLAIALGLLAGLLLCLIARLVSGLCLHLGLTLCLLLLLPRLFLATQAGRLHLHLLLLLLAHACGIGHGAVAVLPVLRSHARLRGCRGPRRHAGIATPVAGHGGSGQGGGQGGWRALHRSSLGRLRGLRPLAELAGLGGRHRVHPGLQRGLRPVIGPEARASAICAIVPGKSLGAAGRHHALGGRGRAALRWPQAQALGHAGVRCCGCAGHACGTGQGRGGHAA